VYDYVSLFEPYVNKHLKYYGIPYNFRFRRVLGKTVMQYRLFSTYSSWLPEVPDKFDETTAGDQSDLSNFTPVVDLYSLFQMSKASLFKELKVNPDESHVNSSAETEKTLKIVREIRSQIEEMEKKSIDHLTRRLYEIC
jgi:hypothetical protein